MNHYHYNWSAYEEMNPSRRTSASTESGVFSPSSSGLSTPNASGSIHGSPLPDLSAKLSAESLAQIEPVPFGLPGSLSSRVALTIEEGTRMISPWHDIQLIWPDGLVSCVCKSPAGTWLRYEVAVSEPMHPLRLTRVSSAFKDSLTKKLESGYVLKRTQSRGWQRVRSLILQSFRPAHFIDNSPWNIGMLPQTWGNTGKLGCASRSTPDGTLGVIEIGYSKTRKTGEVYLVKPLAAFSVQDESGEVSWKIIAIDTDDPMAGILRDANDIQIVLPGVIEMLTEWLESHIDIRPGFTKKLNIRGPFPLSTAINKIRDHHKAWQISKTSIIHKEMPYIPPGTRLTPKLLDKVWMEFTEKDRKSLIGIAPASNPFSLLLHDASWFGEEEDSSGSLVVDIIQKSEPLMLPTVPEDINKELSDEEPFDLTDEVENSSDAQTTATSGSSAEKEPTNLSFSDRKGSVRIKVLTTSPDTVLPHSTLIARVQSISLERSKTENFTPIKLTKENVKGSNKNGLSSLLFMWRKKKLGFSK